MAVSYKKLFKLLIDRDMKKKEFRDYVGISYSTMSKLEKGEKASIAKAPLMDVRVPEMVIKLKQGIGRLIRNFTDTGIVCIIDRRLRDEPPERYHDVTWASLPIKNKTRSLDELRNFYESLPSRHDDVER